MIRIARLTKPISLPLRGFVPAGTLGVVKRASSSGVTVSFGPFFGTVQCRLEHVEVMEVDDPEDLGAMLRAGQVGLHLSKDRAKRLLVGKMRRIMIEACGTWTGNDREEVELIVDCIVWPLEQRIAALETRLAAMEPSNES